ncbi:MAG: toll/interleukin-1 receptor domain-containing protein [Crocinitomicaceae bacterium]|nr:toll/interleukin-1 receptor domain-containing protein [Crocinitomicaceae bacterium]MBK8925018.1 toll/interleukin-1 receptor domain-containing protein [Crocinitomicaceae bacterium]
MALFTEALLRERVKKQLQKGNSTFINESLLQSGAKVLLEKSINEQRLFSKVPKQYDIFLSHSSEDEVLVEGLRLEIQDMGYSVYVDWIEDPELDRSNVTIETAQLLKDRMQNCKSLIYAISENSYESIWIPWELGYFDGINGKIAILPISKQTEYDYEGAEYLGLYNYVQRSKIKGTDTDQIWVYEKSDSYVSYKNWLTGIKPYKR